ncbi:hypothetical protein B1759_17840 [Rubrivirga sp. SAORIC476]|uniref:hypothetical protein n=1 Tax=Rubrivirga sp. SAORIC476 TaxID=1961794 RepID=UPI000BA900EB|nr:hypothetical protein [Rubrivirga sp. SAORIC476]PAP74297.1 hypothetical protein B1759_17840 [Rubrivirga sp. SAORIC476]
MRLRILVLGLLTAGCSPERPAESAPPVSNARAVPEAARPDSLPSTVAETRAVILAAAAREDWAALDSLAAWTPGPGQSPFLYTLGPTFGPPSIFWRTHGGEGLLDEMTAVLQSTPQLSDGGAGWPTWAWTPPTDLSPADRALFEGAVPDPSAAFTAEGDYVGPVTFIDSTGRWLRYVAGE